MFPCPQHFIAKKTSMHSAKHTTTRWNSHYRAHMQSPRQSIYRLLCWSCLHPDQWNCRAAFVIYTSPPCLEQTWQSLSCTVPGSLFRILSLRCMSPYRCPSARQMPQVNRQRMHTWIRATDIAVMLCHVTCRREFFSKNVDTRHGHDLRRNMGMYGCSWKVWTNFSTAV